MCVCVCVCVLFDLRRFPVNWCHLKGFFCHPFRTLPFAATCFAYFVSGTNPQENPRRKRRQRANASQNRAKRGQTKKQVANKDTKTGFNKVAKTCQSKNHVDHCICVIVNQNFSSWRVPPWLPKELTACIPSDLSQDGSLLFMWVGW